jgi:exoribonuclease-2
MYLMFDEAGKFLAARLLSESDASAQVELDSGKRLKVKLANVMLRFDKPAPAQFMEQAFAISQAVELELAWEFAPEGDFGFADLAREYFSDKASVLEQAGMLMRLFEAPHYFRRAGKGLFRKAPADIVAQALAAIEKKRLQTELIAQWARELTEGHCPAPVRAQLYKILFKPDKNAPEYKAVVQASRDSRTAPLDLLLASGAIDSPYQFHWKRFLLENFPQGTAFPAMAALTPADDLPLAPVAAFSIDDSATTEIDDALSLHGLGSGTVTMGVHIAAPGLAIAPDSDIDRLGRHRLSTVYMPGYKLTMLPDALVQVYTLQQGRNCPALSLYITLDEQTLEVKHSETRIESLHISHNLRHDQLDSLVTEQWLQAAQVTDDGSADSQRAAATALHRQLAFLHRFACAHKARREIVRGKPESFNRPDYNFRLPELLAGEPAGNESVQISVRQRGAPLDLIVAEAMILANSTWGQWLASLGVPAIYRSQASMAPGVKVRMGTKALPHAGIGVPSYAWSTSPLRRYTDLVNQWQIIACVRHGSTAALAAPFKPKDAQLFSIISAFEATYAAYNSYQAAMERFWTLQYLRQNAITELRATVIKEGMARADALPLVLAIAAGVGLPRGAQVRLRLGTIDLMTLDVSATVLERLDSPQEAGDPGAAAALASGAQGDEEEDLVGPITIAVDVLDTPDPA